MVDSVRSFVFLHGVCVGGICLHHKHNPHFCAVLVHFWKIFSEIIRCVFDILHNRDLLRDADPLRWLPSNTLERAHGFPRSLSLHSSSHTHTLLAS